jgi:hypothetical protein
VAAGRRGETRGAHRHQPGRDESRFDRLDETLETFRRGSDTGRELNPAGLQVLGEEDQMIAVDQSAQGAERGGSRDRIENRVVKAVDRAQHQLVATRGCAIHLRRDRSSSCCASRGQVSRARPAWEAAPIGLELFRSA